jgi:uncharacterized protein
MQISNAIRFVLVGAAFAAAVPALGFEVKDAPTAASTLSATPVPPGTVPSGTVTPFQAFRTGTQSYLAGEKEKAVSELSYAAEQGHALAAWKLGRMYAEGDGVKRNDLKAFQYFSKLANDNADVSPFGAQARFVANAFVAVGNYYQTGISNSEVKPNVDRARKMYSYAATYFGDPDAQYQLAKLCLKDKDNRQAGRWLSLAARKGQHQAQAVLGHMLFNGDGGLPREQARGLMWLTLAREGAAGAEDGWIVEYYEDAIAHANDNDRDLARVYVEQWAASQR